jgi:MFS family permease
MPETGKIGGSEKSGMANMFRALSHRNYQLFFSGQGISMIGTWMTRIATSWLVYKLTGSALLLGVVGFSGQIPAFLLAPFAGVIVDRMNRHRLLVITQILAMVQSLAMAVLALTGYIEMWHIIVLSIFQGLINAVDMPARQSFVIEMVEDRSDLPNAIALNSSLVNAARLIGPSVGGVVIAAVGEGWCFAIDGISYIAVIASLLAMNVKPAMTVEKIKRTNILRELRDGWRYVAGSPPISKILILLAIVSLVGMPYTILMPVFAEKILGGGPNTLGFLMASTGIGALIGALFLASRKTVLGLGRFIPRMAGLFGVGLIAFSFSRVLWLSMILLVATGLGFMVQMAVSNTIIQTIVDEDKRGRVMSFYTMAFMGTIPFGSLLAGMLADQIGSPETLLFGGIGCVVAAVWFARALPRLRKFVRPIYIEKGILPEMRKGVLATVELSIPPES